MDARQALPNRRGRTGSGRDAAALTDPKSAPEPTWRPSVEHPGLAVALDQMLVVFRPVLGLAGAQTAAIAISEPLSCFRRQAPCLLWQANLAQASNQCAIRGAKIRMGLQELSHRRDRCPVVAHAIIGAAQIMQP